MITIEEAKEISIKKELADVEQLEVIRRYIFDKTEVDVGQIERPIGKLTKFLQMDYELMTIAFETAAKYYAKN